MSRKIITTDKAPAAIGPYSQGIITNNLLYTSMQIPLDPQTGELVGKTAAEQIKQCLENINHIINAAGADLNDVVKTTVYLTDMNQFNDINTIYSQYFSDSPPARGVIEVSALPKGALIAIEAIAQINPLVNSPEIGSVFTVRADIEVGKRDYGIHRIRDFTGYIRKNPYFKEKLIEGEYYRFVVVAAHRKRRHNYFYALPLREIGKRESRKLNYLDPATHLRLIRLAERLLGIKFRNKKS